MASQSVWASRGEREAVERWKCVFNFGFIQRN